MATMYITEYSSLAYVGAGTQLGQMPLEPNIAEQAVSIGGASTASAGFNTATKFIRVHVDAICSIAIGATPTAVTTAHRLAANETDYYAVIPGHKIAVISNS